MLDLNERRETSACPLAQLEAAGCGPCCDSPLLLRHLEAMALALGMGQMSRDDSGASQAENEDEAG